MRNIINFLSKESFKRGQIKNIGGRTWALRLPLKLFCKKRKKMADDNWQVPLMLLDRTVLLYK
jgi:hypothetical protein